MGIGPAVVIPALLEKNKLKVDDIDIYEVNEAFASVVRMWEKDTGGNLSRVNIHGGAIALGHPFGCSGARITGAVLNVLEEKDAQFGLSTMCIGLGQGISTIIERV